MSALKIPTYETVGFTAWLCLIRGCTNSETVDAIKAKFPRSRASSRTVSSYRCMFRKWGYSIIGDREARLYREFGMPQTA